MSLQNDFLTSIEDIFSNLYQTWDIEETEQWLKVHTKINAKKQIILWVKKPNKDDSFWVFITINSQKILSIPNIISKTNSKDSRKLYVGFSDAYMIEITDRGLTETNPWGEKWPVGFKIQSSKQFELAKKIVLLHLTSILK